MSKPKQTDPTPEEIAAEAAKIRAEWPEHRWRKEEPEIGRASCRERV